MQNSASPDALVHAFNHAYAAYSAPRDNFGDDHAYIVHLRTEITNAFSFLQDLLYRPRPIDMVLYCPNCGFQHVDGEEPAHYAPPEKPSLTVVGSIVPGLLNPGRWTNPPHRSHLCHNCKHIWRPADVPTNGVLQIQTQGQNDSPILPSAKRHNPAQEKYAEVLTPFMALMCMELHANSYKGDRPGWLGIQERDCLLDIYHHVAKLAVAVNSRDQRGVAEHSADVANVCMMMADLFGLLGTWPEKTPEKRLAHGVNY